jgi:hypothetical protein
MPAMGSVTDLVIDSYNPDRFAEFTIPKLLDAASPKVADDGNGMPTESPIPDDRDLVFGMSGGNGSNQREGNAVAMESLEIGHEGFQGDDGGIIIDWTNGDDSSHRAGDEGPAEGIAFVHERPHPLGGDDDGWCICQEIDDPAKSGYSGSHLLYQDIVIV